MPSKGDKEEKKTTQPVRPVQGPIDHEALVKDIIKRFPKVLARLAE